MTMVPERPVPPSRRDAAMAAEASRALSPFGHVLELRLQLGEGGVLLLPRPPPDLLRRALLEIAQGHAVAVIAVDAELTTQEAANHLKVSRPHLIASSRRARSASAASAPTAACASATSRRTGR